MKNCKYRIFWTIWALGWHRTKSWQGKTIELKLFVGPVVIVWW